MKVARLRLASLACLWVCSSGCDDCDDTSGPIVVPITFDLVFSRAEQECAHVDVFLLLADRAPFVDPDDPELEAEVERADIRIRGVLRAFVAGVRKRLEKKDLAIGVGRYEDFGGLRGGIFSDSTDPDDRPFILNQPILSTAVPDFDALVLSTTGALDRTAPGFGGDDPQAAIEALYQVSTGDGFDGDRNGSSLNSGRAGAISTQLSPGPSGDVPTFASNVALTSGTLGGVGWREGSCRYIILASDTCTVAPIENPDPLLVEGSGVTRKTADFACESAIPGVERFGFIEGAAPIGAVVAPLAAHTLQGAVSALNGLRIQVIGLSTRPVPWLFHEALAELTGAVDSNGEELAFGIGENDNDGRVADKLATAVASLVSPPLTVRLTSANTPAGEVVIANEGLFDVEPGQTSLFTITMPPGVVGRFNLLDGLGNQLANMEITILENPCQPILSRLVFNGEPVGDLSITACKE